MGQLKYCTFLLLLLLKFNICKGIDINPDDMLGFEAPAQSKHGKIIPYFVNFGIYIPAPRLKLPFIAIY